MKKVITTVGTSIFNKYFEKMKNIKTLYESIKGKSYTGEYDDYKNQAEKIRKEVLKFYKNNYSEDISAEIKSINKIKSYLKEDLQIYLLASDTIISYIASKILKELLIEENFEVYFNEKHDIIRDLQVEDRDRFINIGLPNLIERIEYIAMGYTEGQVNGKMFSNGGYYGDILFNISGGYKATIPYLTMLAQINGADIYYIFEDTEELITIPPVPITIDMELFDEYKMKFKELEDVVENYSEWKNRNFQFVQKAGSCIQASDNIGILSPLGEILWRSYKSKFVNFYATEKVLEKIKKNNILIDKILKFANEGIRASKTEIKGKEKSQHYVYDDGDNNYRIFYFEKNNDLFIYEIFDDEEKQVDYLNKQVKSVEYHDLNIYCSINKATKELTYEILNK